jgi:hypothetical protein
MRKDDSFEIYSLTHVAQSLDEMLRVLKSRSPVTERAAPPR